MIEADELTFLGLLSVLDGRHYNRGIRAHKIVAEAMEPLRWATFLERNEKQHDAGSIIALATTIGPIPN